MSSASQGGMYLDFGETAGSPITGKVVKERKGSNSSINPTCWKLPAWSGTATGSLPRRPPFAARPRLPREQAEGRHYIEEGILGVSKQKATKETTSRPTAGSRLILLEANPRVVRPSRANANQQPARTQC